ncbi:hypothetical protein BGZ46_002567 [Entomortierella lignicola]|nr:hypothetical protein BGZ46_002567 [Entomortierella lignicola]
MSTELSNTSTVVIEATAKHTATVIILHGLGDTGAGWIPVGEQLGPLMPHVKFIFPTGPVRPITVNNGAPSPAWYDIHPFSRHNPTEDEEGIYQSRDKTIIREEVDVNNIPPSRIIVTGFSQGCALTLLIGMTLEYPLGGLGALSGYVPLHKKIMKLATPHSRKSPIFWGHGTFDPIIKIDLGEDSTELLRAMKYKVDFHSYPKMGHSVCPDEIKDLGEFFLKTLPSELAPQDEQNAKL